MSKYLFVWLFRCILCLLLWELRLEFAECSLLGTSPLTLKSGISLPVTNLWGLLMMVLYNICSWHVYLCTLYKCFFLFSVSKIQFLGDSLSLFVYERCKIWYGWIIYGMIRVTKENRTAGVLENFAEGERYAEHGLRKFVRNKAPQIMPSINAFFSDPKYWSISQKWRVISC